MTTLKEMYDRAVTILDENGIDSPENDAFLLLQHVTGTDRTHYLLDKARAVDGDTVNEYMGLIGFRSRHIPCQYIIGETDFMGYSFRVTPDVLIPRLDTEVLCDEAVKLITDGDKILDMCTGSGCLAVSIKRICPKTEVTACDISEKALEIAADNALRNHADIRFVESDLFGKLEGDVFNIIISNPPYVTDEEYSHLSPEVKDNEPRLALTAGEDGMDIYRRLIPDAAEHLIPGGWLIMEIGCFQAEKTVRLMENCGYTGIKIIKDLAGLDRVVLGRTVV